MIGWLKAGLPTPKAERVESDPPTVSTADDAGGKGLGSPVASMKPTEDEAQSSHGFLVTCCRVLRVFIMGDESVGKTSVVKSFTGAHVGQSGHNETTKGMFHFTFKTKRSGKGFPM